MKKQKKNLLVTLAREEQAKQLFSSAYWNAGWKGDYMLLTPENELSEKQLKWFRDKGILIKKCKLLPNSEKSRAGNWPRVVFAKFYIFKPEFKKWENIIFIEEDMIIRASLDDLTKIKGFAAVHEGRLLNNFLKNIHLKLEGISKKSYNKLLENYNLNEPIFNAGVMAFNTSIIKKDTFSKLQKLLNQYIEITTAMEESILNLYFYKKWEKLPIVYNINPYHLINFKNIKPEKIKGIIFHFRNHKPWNSKNYFYEEWKNNLNKAEHIDLKKSRVQNIKKWAEKDIKKYSLYLKNKNFSYKYFFYKIKIFIDRIIGLIGIFLKRNHPRLYWKLKKMIS